MITICKQKDLKLKKIYIYILCLALRYNVYQYRCVAVTITKENFDILNDLTVTEVGFKFCSGFKKKALHM